MRRTRVTAVSLLAAVALVMAGHTSAHSDPGPLPGGATVPAAAGQPATEDGASAGLDDSADATARQQDDLTGDITFSVPSGTFQGQVSVSLGTTVADAQIRYTTNGTLPTAFSRRYSGSPLQFTETTQLRAQAFVRSSAVGDPGTALYLARSTDATHDLPVMVLDAYGAGKPGREYQDVATMVMEPEGGSTSLSAAPTVATRAGFHLRGQSTSSFDKAPYRLELWDNEDDDEDYPMLGMPEEADWVLRGPFADKSLIRDAFIYGLGRDMGMAAPRFAFVELYTNLDGPTLDADDYQGVYMLVETIKDGPDRVDITEMEETDTTPPAVTGGYIFKFEWLASEEPIVECPAGLPNCWRDLEVKRPKELQPEQEEWLARHLGEFHEALRGSNPSDPQNGYPAYIDVDSFVDQIIVNELSREMDAYIRSQYFYKDRGEKIVAGPLWDYNLIFGTGGFYNNDQIQGWQFEQTRQPIANDWFVRLMDDPSFAQRVDTRWRELRRGPLSDSRLNARITQLAAPLTNAAQRNFQKWPNLTDRMVGPFVTSTEATWDGQVEAMRAWVLQRAAWLDSSGWQPGASPGARPETGPQS